MARAVIFPSRLLTARFPSGRIWGSDADRERVKRMQKVMHLFLHPSCVVYS